MQVYVPLNTPGVTYEDTRTFSRGLAQLLERRDPDLVVSDMSKAKRDGQGVRRLEPERPPQDDGQRLLAARDGAPDGLDAADLGRGRGDGRSGVARVHVRRGARARGASTATCSRRCRRWSRSSALGASRPGRARRCTSRRSAARRSARRVRWSSISPPQPRWRQDHRRAVGRVVAVAVLQQRDDHRPEVDALLGQPVLEALRALLVADPLQHALVDEPRESRGRARCGRCPAARRTRRSGGGRGTTSRITSIVQRSPTQLERPGDRAVLAVVGAGEHSSRA